MSPLPDKTKKKTKYMYLVFVFPRTSNLNVFGFRFVFFCRVMVTDNLHELLFVLQILMPLSFLSGSGCLSFKVT